MFYDKKEQEWRERFGMNLWKFVDNKGYSIKDTAQMSGIAPTTISNWLTGYSTPTVYNLMKLADFLEVSIDELVRV